MTFNGIHLAIIVCSVLLIAYKIRSKQINHRQSGRFATQEWGDMTLADLKAFVRFARKLRTHGYLRIKNKINKT